MGKEYDELFLRMKEWADKHFIDNGSRTSERQKANLHIILKDPNQDLYKMNVGGTTCAFCASREGRVYSRSGKDPVFPPLALAFQKIDENGPDVLWNTYLVNHPNTLHTIYPWSEGGRTEEEIEEAKRFSSLITNPLEFDPRTPKQIKFYKARLASRKKWLRSYKLFKNCSALQIEKFPKTFQTFEKHKKANDAKYKAWMDEYSRIIEKKGAI